MNKTPCRHGVRVVRRPESDERGVVIVFLAIALTMLMIFAAFMVDLGAWYKQAQDLQRTADAAALAASTYVGGNAAPQPSNVDLPANCGASEAVVLSVAPQSVYCSALKVVLKNGYDQAYTDPTFMTTTVDQPDHKVQVVLNQANVGSYFSSFFHGPITINRTSSAVFSAPIPLGSPQNYFGTGNLPGFPGVSVGPDAQANNGPDFWAAIAGACAPAEMGDPVASYWDGNVGTGTVGGIPDYEANDFTGGPNGSTCGNTTAEVKNPQFNGAGYLYDISVPSGGATLYVYNPYYDPCETDDFGNSYTLDIDWNYGAYSTCGSTNTKMTMYYALQAPGSGTWTITTKTPKTAANQIKQFTRLAQLSTPGTYLLNISSVLMSQSGGILVPTQSADTSSFGTHVYSLLATKNSSGPATLAISTANDTGYACTTLTDPQCPQVYADPNGGGAEAEIISGATTKSATAYLASIPPSAIGHDVQIKLFGPGVLGQFLEILDATGTPLPSFSETASGNNTATIPASGSPPVISTCQDPTNGNANFTDPDTGNPVASGSACLPVDQCVTGPTDTVLTEVACTNPVTLTSAIAAGGQITSLDLNIPGTVYSGDQIYVPAPCIGFYQTFDVAGTAGQTWTGNQTVPIYSASPSCAYPANTVSRADRVGGPNNRIGPAIYGDGTVTLTFTVTPGMLGCASQASCTTATNNGWFSLRETVQTPPVNNVLNFNVAVLGLPPHLTP